MSLLQLPLDLQERIASKGEWPDDGLASTVSLHGDLPRLVADARDKASRFHNVKQIIEDEYQFLLDDVTTTDSIGATSSGEGGISDVIQRSQCMSNHSGTPSSDQWLLSVPSSLS